MEESDPEYLAEIARLKENARKEKLRQKALRDFKTQQRAERVRDGVEAVKTFRKENHIPTKSWLPAVIICLWAVWQGLSVPEPTLQRIWLTFAFTTALYSAWSVSKVRAGIKTKYEDRYARERESQLSELEARGQADRKKASEPKGDS